MQGKVKWFNAGKGFGFIVSDDGSDYFVHYKEIQGQEGFKNLTEGDKVTFEHGHSPRGPLAKNVKVLTNT